MFIGLFKLDIGLFTLLKSVFQVDVDTIQNGPLFEDQLSHLFENLSKLVDALDDILDLLISV